MAEHEQDPSAEPTTSEEATAQADAAPALNREQRRAQAKGKKAGGAGTNPALPHAQNMRGPGAHGPAGGATRFQRKTGGK